MNAARKDNPSSIFYWKDYENDEGLRVSSLAAQGLWMRLLCIAAKADPYGYILINGCDIGVTGAARLGSVSEAEAATLLDELERNGVFSRDRKGRPFSRRMVKDAATRAKNTKNGKKGGNPALSASIGKEKEKSGSVNPPHNPPDKAPYPLPHSPTVREGGGGVARACEREADPPRADDLIWRILHVIGFDRGQIIPKYWTAPDAPLIVQRWRDDLGLTDDQIVEVSRLNAAQHSEPARGPKILVPAMQAYAAALHAPRLDPSTPTPNQNPGGKNDRHAERRAFDSTIHKLADGIAAGTIDIDTRSRDPWEYARRSLESGNPADGEHDAGPVFRP